MHPEKIEYAGKAYTLVHLRQSIRQFKWTPKDAEEVTFSVRLRYSNHCYSRNLDPGELQQPEHVLCPDRAVRVFCPDRHSHTERLCAMMGGLFDKPGTSVALTQHHNWTTYQIYAPVGRAAQVRYCAFFTVRNDTDRPIETGTHALDMYVESAYVKEDSVPTRKRVPFGKVAEMTMFGQRYF